MYIAHSFFTLAVLLSLLPATAFRFQPHTSTPAAIVSAPITASPAHPAIGSWQRQWQRLPLQPLQLFLTKAPVAQPKPIKVRFMAEYIEPQSLAADLRMEPLTAAADSSTVVIDVRSNMEYAEGHIRGARHLPSDQFMNNNFVRNIIEDHKLAKRVVFHCALSKQRGPTCARIFYSELLKLKQEKAAAGESTTGAYSPKVMVLQGGFEAFGAQFGDDESIVEVDEMFR